MNAMNFLLNLGLGIHRTPNQLQFLYVNKINLNVIQ